MPTVLIREIDRATRKIQNLRELDLASVPTKDDKIVLDIDGIGYIFNIVDVHYADNKMVDVNLIRLSTITEFEARRYAE